MQELLQIKVLLVDEVALARLTHALITAYLERHGWEHVSHDSLTTSWRHGETQLSVPNTFYGSALRLRIWSIVRDVALSEDRSELAVYVEMLEGR